MEAMLKHGLLARRAGFVALGLAVMAALAVSAGSLSADVRAGAPPSRPESPLECYPIWQVVDSPNPEAHSEFHDVAVMSASDVWAVGEYIGGTLVEHWDG